MVKTILRMGYRVRVLDNLSTGKRENVELFASHPCYEFMLGDVTSPETCRRACADVDFVLHEAAWGSVPRSMEMPDFYCANNVSGTVNMLEAARRGGVKRFVYASSSSVYGDSTVLPKREGEEGCPLSPYALTKRQDEEWARTYTAIYGLETVGLRYFNVFGRRQDPNGSYAAVIPKFIKQLMAGETPTIYGDGRQSRDFTYVENVVEANLRACLAPREAAGEVYNIACGGREYLIDVYHALTEALGLDVEPVLVSARAGDIRDSYADITRARKMLGYDPDYGFAEGLREAIAWYRDHL